LRWRRAFPFPLKLRAARSSRGSSTGHHLRRFPRLF
jgi:hypothetical protein